jgi:hypothetical protein
MDLDSYSRIKEESDAYVETGHTSGEAGDYARSERIGTPIQAALRAAARLYSGRTPGGWDTPSFDTDHGQFTSGTLLREENV